VVFIIAGLRSEHRAAFAHNGFRISPTRARPVSLLPPRLLAASLNFGASFCFVRTGTMAGQILLHGLVHEESSLIGPPKAVCGSRVFRFPPFLNSFMSAVAIFIVLFFHEYVTAVRSGDSTAKEKQIVLLIDAGDAHVSPAITLRLPGVGHPHPFDDAGRISRTRSILERGGTSDRDLRGRRGNDVA
jgi:hypothetical protein